MSEDIQILQKQLNIISTKVDHLDRQVDLISDDLNISRGVKIHFQLDEIINYLKIVCKDLDEGQVSMMRNKMDTVMKNIEYINKKIEG